MYHGYGGYGQKVGKFLKRNRVGQLAARAAMGGLTGGPMGAANALMGGGMYRGRGEYVAPANDILASSKSTMDIVPKFSDMAEESVTISRREYVSEIFGPPLVNGAPQPFTLQSYSINPGLERTFPWLSQIAQNYDEYEIKQLVFTFKSTTTESTNSGNGQVGMVILNTNYNSAAADFQDKAEMQQYTNVSSARLTESCQHFVECDPDKNSGSKGEYVRANPVIENQDIKTYDHGKFQIAISNVAASYANVSLGELWVSYTILLRKPKFFTAIGLGITRDIWCSNLGETAANPFGPLGSGNNALLPRNILRGQQNNLGTIVENPTANNIDLIFPPWYRGYLTIMFCMDGSGFQSATGGTIQGVGNVEIINDMYGSSNNGSADSPQALVQCFKTDQVIQIFHIKVDIATNGITNKFGWSTGIQTATTVAQSYIQIDEYNSGFSYRAANRGDNDAPIFVNNSGTIVVPL